MVTVYLWLHGFIPIATAIHIVCCLVGSIRDGQSRFSLLKDTFMSFVRREAACLLFRHSRWEKKVIFT